VSSTLSLLAGGILRTVSYGRFSLGMESAIFEANRTAEATGVGKI
jgi:hypothetical protein